MLTVEQYKAEVICQLGKLQAEGREPVLPLQKTPSDAAIRAIAELEAEGIVVFDDNILACRLTGHGSKIADELIREFERNRRRK